MNDTNILLESGTNELEVLEFTVDDQSFGINIAKVSEIMTYKPVMPIPDTPPEFEGIFSPRDTVISVIDLHKVLKKPEKERVNDLLIICHFNQMDVGFHVSGVKGIQRISWEDIEKPPSVSQGATAGIATGIAKIEGRIILILDFEKIVADMNSSVGLDMNGLDRIERPDYSKASKRIIIAEDSPFLNKLIVETLHSTGYTNLVSFTNGKEAWDFIENEKNSSVDNIVDLSCVITDIEMPKMDGHHLTKRIKEDRFLKHIPVILFSSLINDQMYKKGLAVGADAQFSKPQISKLVECLNSLV